VAAACLTVVTGAAPAETDRIEGNLQRYVVDYPGSHEGSRQTEQAPSRSSQDGVGAEREYYLRTDDGETVELEPGESGALEDIGNGERIAVDGRRTMLRTESGGTAQRMRVTEAETVEGFEKLAPSERPESKVQGGGTLNVLAVQVKFERSDDVVSKDAISKALYDGGTSAAATYNGNAAPSRAPVIARPNGTPNIVTVEVDFTLTSCDNFQIPSFRETLMDALPNSLPDHDAKQFFLAKGPSSSCGWLGIAQERGKWSMVRGSDGWVSAHELGHNFFLQHIDTATIMASGKPAKSQILIPHQRVWLRYYGPREDKHPEKLRTLGKGTHKVTLGAIGDYSHDLPHTVFLPPQNEGWFGHYVYFVDGAPGTSAFDTEDRVVSTTQKDMTTEIPSFDPKHMSNLNVGESSNGEKSDDIKITVQSIGDGQAKVKIENNETDRVVAHDVHWTMAPGNKHEGQIEVNNPKGGNLKFEVPTSRPWHGPEEGSIDDNADGSFTFTANNDASGRDTFPYWIKRNGGYIDPEGQLIVDFNQPPKTEDVKTEVDPSEGGEIQLKVSDKESEPNTLAYEVVEEPSKGEVTMNDGPEDSAPTMTYKPNDGASGKDSFTYRAADSFSQSNESEVTVELADSGDSDDGGDGTDDSGSDDGGDDNSSGGSNASGSGDNGGGGGAIGGWSLMLLLGLAAAGRRRAARA
jgi:hypothetical protein